MLVSCLQALSKFRRIGSLATQRIIPFHIVRAISCGQEYILFCIIILEKTTLPSAPSTQIIIVFTTTLYLLDGPEKFDELVEAFGVRVLIDSKALINIIGTRMDFVEDRIKREFVFEHPNAKGTCGCGESFTT